VTNLQIKRKEQQMSADSATHSEVEKAINHLAIARKEATDSDTAERITAAITALESPVVIAKRLAQALAAHPFSTSDGSDDPNRASLIGALNAFIVDREACQTGPST
jgi:hypothetical protein